MKSRIPSPPATQASATGINTISPKNRQPHHPPTHTPRNEKISSITQAKAFPLGRAEIKWYSPDP